MRNGWDCLNMVMRCEVLERTKNSGAGYEWIRRCHLSEAAKCSSCSVESYHVGIQSIASLLRTLNCSPEVTSWAWVPRTTLLWTPEQQEKQPRMLDSVSEGARRGIRQASDLSGVDPYHNRSFSPGRPLRCETIIASTRTATVWICSAG